MNDAVVPRSTDAQDAADAPSDADLRAALADLLRRHVDPSRLDDGPLRGDVRLVEDLALDSIQRMTLAMVVEDHFRICLDEADEQQIETVDHLVAIIRRRRAGA
ncbi:MAG: acyl carrier protein [Acidobacteriota bacterium]